MPTYDPSTDYAASYDALSRRIASNFAQQRGNLNQELATRGVQTSGVSAIPSAALRVGENDAKDQVAGQYALEQAHTGIEDRQAATAFERQKQLAQMGWDYQNSIARRQADAGLKTALISGGLGAIGAIAGGPVGAGGGSSVGRKLAANQAGEGYGSVGGYA